MDNIEIFQNNSPTLENYWRSVILFGRNVASYKFALGKSLLDLVEQGKSQVSLEELSLPFSKHICEHLQICDKQATSRSSTFLDACRNYNSNNIDLSELISITEKKGFNNVLDAFHIVNGKEIPVRFFEVNNIGQRKQLILTDNVHLLKEIKFENNLYHEIEARWRLVETAWDLSISRNLLAINYDDNEKLLFTTDNNLRRRSITSVREALNGYQKGKCFYCFDDISVEDNESMCDVDHFFPHVLQQYCKINLDGVWNLVLSCKECNRGHKGKFAQVPEKKYLERLYKRNEFLISSHHPLRETLIQQTGGTPELRQAFLNEMDKFAIELLLHRWKAEKEFELMF
ncbi:MAG: HNH endonuclease domain-containing protein [Candidatus Ornithomonoglobus sp.]